MTALALISICGSGILLVLAGEVVTRRSLRRFADRGCTGRHWRRAFPGASNAEIREYLDVLLLTFGINQRFRLAFAPDDKIMDVYRAVEPPFFSMGVDAEELESFVEDIEKRFGVDLLPDWREKFTLGEIFARTRS